MTEIFGNWDDVIDVLLAFVFIQYELSWRRLIIEM